MILPDNETRVYLLNNEAIAKTIVKLLRKRPDHPITIGVHGDWGGRQVQRFSDDRSRFERRKERSLPENQRGRSQGFEDAKIALIEGIVTGLIEKRPLLNSNYSRVF